MQVVRNGTNEYYRRVTHCLFDMDGTVLDSEVMYHKIVHEICKKYNKIYSKALEMKMYGVTDREVSVTVVRELKLPIAVEDFETQVSFLAHKILPSAPLQEGVERLMSHLYKHNILMALATNSSQQAVRLQTAARPKLFGMFHHMVSASDPAVGRGKPNPDVYLVAAQRFPDKPKPEMCLVFEDSVMGVRAGRAAGMQVVMIPNRRLDRELTRHATLVLRSMLDFKPELFGLPPFGEMVGPNYRHGLDPS